MIYEMSSIYNFQIFIKSTIARRFPHKTKLTIIERFI